MPDLNSIIDSIHYDGTRGYTRAVGSVDYLDGTVLSRPSKMPRTQKLMAAVIVAAALVLGIVFLNNTVISRMQEALTAEQTIAANLARESSLATVPNMADLINLDDEAIRTAFANAGFKIYDASSLYDSNNMTLLKLPADMTVDEAGAMLVRGISGLSASQASKLLNGSWYFVTDRIGAPSMVVRYADFTTGDPQIAVQNALAHEGFDPVSTTESGVDDSGNTYSMGTLVAGETLCTWKISALPLDEMYSISGLPDEACYVGIRLTIQ